MSGLHVATSPVMMILPKGVTHGSQATLSAQ